MRKIIFILIISLSPYVGFAQDTIPSLAGVELNSKYTETMIRGMIANVSGLILVSSDNDSLVNTVIFIPTDNDNQSKNISCVEYNDILYALGDALGLWAPTTIFNGNNMLIVGFYKDNYELTLKLYSVEAKDYLIITLNRI